MNHLCNSHCEFCGSDLAQEYEEQGQGYAFFAIQLVDTRGKMPAIIDYGFQDDFSCSVCWACASRLLASDTASYKWNKCHCCGFDTHREDDSAFRMFELEAENLEQHPYKQDLYEFISADTTVRKGPVGYTVCMNCVLPELVTTSDSGHEMLKVIVEEAISEGDVSETYTEMIPA